MTTDTPLMRVPGTQLNDAMRAARERSVERRGDATFVEVMGNAPELFAWYADFYTQLFYGGRVAVRYKELLRYRLSTRHGCRHCNLGNRLDAIDAGIADAELAAIERDDLATFAAGERAVLTFAERMALTTPDGHVDAELHAALSEHFDDAEIIELGIVAAVLSGMAKFLFAYDLVEREASCPIGRSHGG